MAKRKKTTAEQAIALKSQGMKNVEIAKKLGTSPNYVSAATSEKTGKKRPYKRRSMHPSTDAAAQLDVITAINSVKSMADEQRLEMIRKIVQ